MEITVFSDDKTPKEPEICLRLTRYGSEVQLCIVDPHTGQRIENGDVAVICNDGTLHLCTIVNPDSGLKLDKDRKIILS